MSDEVTHSPMEATVAAVMTKAVISTTAETTVSEVARVLHSQHITGMPVLDDHLHVIGVVSEMDVVMKSGRTVADIMSSEPRTIEEQIPLSEAADLLMNDRIRRLPVVRHGKLVGLISRTDLVTFFAQHQWACGHCGQTARGLRPPQECPGCGAPSAEFRLEDGPHGM